MASSKGREEEHDKTTRLFYWCSNINYHLLAGVYGNGNCGLPIWDLRGKLFPCCKLLIPLQDALNWKISGQVDGDPIYVKEVFNRTQEEN